ncbi:MAG TPA: AMP-binding protein [Jatrophihabitans sp.]|nr:AMP-binding protein [Jatrophihabitans sp.]
MAARYRELGRWRSETILDDLARAVRTTPDKPAIVSYLNGKLGRTVSYAELDALVDRFAAGLLELGVQRRDVVAIHLPNSWMLSPLYLACARIGAVAAPVPVVFGFRELGIVLRNTAAKVCIVADSYNDIDYLQRLADAAPEGLRHRVVVRRTTPAAPEGYLDFEEFFVNTPWEQTHSLAGLPVPDADDISFVLFTSGTSGTSKGVIHSHNTLYAGASALPRIWGWDAGTVVSVPSQLTHLAGLIFSAYMSVVLGGTSVVQDDADMGLLLDMIAKHGVTYVYAAPVFYLGLIAEQRKNPRDLSSLRKGVSGSAPIPPQLIAEVREVLGIELGTLWGMTENGPVTVTKPDDPEGWGAHSDGSLVTGSELRIDAEPDEQIGRLLVRGPSQCLGYLNQKEVYQGCLDADGFFDTGDMARPDGRGGIRITGRRDDLIIRQRGGKIPTLEVEAVLLRHPQIREVALIGYPDPEAPGAELPCAVIVPEGEPPTVAQLNEYLDGLGMTWWNWVDRIQVRDSLPRNSLGKVQRPILRQELEQPTSSHA